MGGWGFKQAWDCRLEVKFYGVVCFGRYAARDSFFLGVKVEVFEFMIYDLGYRVQGCRGEGLGLRVWRMRVED